MTPELTALTLAALLQVLQFALYSILANREVGLKYTTSPRDHAPHNTFTARTARLGRAFNNHFEALILFGIAVAVIEMSGQNTGFTATCAWVYLIARMAYVPAYALGLRPWRSLIWMLGFAVTALMLFAALL